MKKIIYLLCISFSLSNCYYYKTMTDNNDSKQKKHIAKQPQKAMASEEVSTDSPLAMSGKPSLSSNLAAPQKAVSDAPRDITQKLEPNKFYRIEVADKRYKIQVNKWQSDTLVAHVIHHPKKILKFHKNQINQNTIAERRFSQPVADVLTVAAYAGIGVGTYLLVR